MRSWLIAFAAVLAAGLGPECAAYGGDSSVKKTAGETVLRAYDVMGMNVRNPQGEKLGDIKDLMIDLGQDASVRYAALDFGGFLGIGDKLFAVPWDAMKLRHDAKNDNRAFLELNATKESLKNAPGFDKNHWPNFADEKWAAGVRKHYRVHTDRANVEVDVNRRGANATGNNGADVNVDVNRKGPRTADNPSASADRTDGALLRRASQVEGIEVKNEADQKIGKVEDLVIDVDSGHVRYVALSFGGFLGVGDKLFAVPWDAVMFQHDAKDKQDCLIFDVSKDTLSKAQGFDKDHWPNFADPQWNAENRRHYQKDIDRAASRAKARRG